MDSASEFGRDHGLIHEAVITGRKAGWGREEWARFAHDEALMRDVLEVMQNRAVITTAHVIDLDAPPHEPKGLTLVEHRKGGRHVWDPVKIALYQSFAEDGDTFRDMEHFSRTFNANVLDFLLKHQDLIRYEWRGRYVFFFGTTYKDLDGNPCVRCMCWDGRRWNGNYVGVKSPFHANAWAAVRVND